MASSSSPSKKSSSKKSSLPPIRDPPQDYVEFILIRHGETTFNADGKYSGQLDTELNDVGRKQAAAVAERLSKEGNISAIYSSDLRSAYQTAQIIAESLGGLQIVVDRDLRERHLGVLQGLSHSEASQTYPAALKAKVIGLEEIPGGGEYSLQLLKRCTRALHNIQKNHESGKRVVVVTHGGTVESLYQLATQKIPEERIVRNASFSVFHFYDCDKRCQNWVDISHLKVKPRKNYY